MTENDAQIQTETEGKSETETVEEKPKKTTQPVQEAFRAIEELKVENDRKDKLLEKEEALMVRQALSGRSEAGIVVEKKKETDEEYAARFESGQVDLLD